jgi:hypothetical protein
MSTMQRIHARTTLIVGRETADVLRTEVKKVAMFEHETFEDFLDFCPEAQHSLAERYRTIFDFIDEVGWDPDTVDPAKRRFKVALTEDLINLLGLRHEDLGRAVNDRIAEHQAPIPPEIQEEITTDQLARATLDQIFRTYDRIAKDPSA